MNLLLLDCESTGVNTKTDRVLTIFVGIMNENGEWTKEKNLMFNPGVEIPEEATNVHGITEEQVARDGIPVEEAGAFWKEIREMIVDTFRELGIAVCAFNGSFDFTIINEELVRYGLAPISWNDMFLLDPLVIDRACDKYRSGKRTLNVVAGHYGVEVDESRTHDASYDCYLTGRIIQSKKFRSYEELKVSKSHLMKLQRAWRREQSESLQSYLRKNAEPGKAHEIVVDPNWPTLY